MNTLKRSLEEIQTLAKERTVKTQTIEYDLETLVKKIKKNIIRLNPDYQRRHRWNNDVSSRLVESLILNIPVPFIYISQDIDVDEETEEGVARYSVIDGQQRLTAIFDFFENKYFLEGLDVLSQLNGSYYKDLPPFLIRRLEERSIKCLRIDSTVDEQVKYDIFERLNSGSVKLEAQELRNATCRGKFKSLLKELSKNETYKKLIYLTDTRAKKMEDEELILRYFALSHNKGYLEYKSGFKKFLTDKMIQFNTFDDKTLKQMGDEFTNVFAYINDCFDDTPPFAKYRFENNSFSNMSNFNAAVYDAVTCCFREAYNARKVLNKDNVKQLFADAEFFSACEGSVNDSSKVTLRINKALELI